MPFGKHKGLPLWEIIKDDPDYANWLLSETDVEFTDEAFVAIEKDCTNLTHQERT